MHLSAIPGGWPRGTPGHLHRDICKFHLPTAHSPGSIIVKQISLEEIIMIDFLQKIFLLCQGWMSNKRGQIFQRNIRQLTFFLIRHFGSRSTPSGSFIFKMAAMLQIPRVFPLIFPRKCKSGPMRPSRAKNWRQKSANPALFPCMSPGSTPRDGR